MKNTTFFKLFSLVIFSIVFVSCDKDYNTIGSGIVGNENFNFTHETFSVKTYNQKVGPIQTNNLPINQLGIFNDNVGAVSGDILGTTRANFVTQLSLVTPSPTFNSHVAIDSVVLTVPYFSGSLSVDSNGHNTYRLDSIYSTNTAYTRKNQVFDPIDLQVYRSNFYLAQYNSSDGFATAQKYFSNQDADFDGHRDSFALNNMVDIPTDNVENENHIFRPSNKEIVKYKVENMVEAAHTAANVESRFSPRMRLHLDNNYFLTNVIQASASNLVNDNAFRDYFRGLYFQVQNATTGSLMSLDFSKGDVTIYYKQDLINNDTANPAPREMKTFVMKMTGTTVNLLNNTDNAVYSTAVSNPNNHLSSTDKLYLKGGQGSQVFVELFPNASELTALRAKNVLVNDASLTFTVNNDNMTDKYRHPQRIYVYDADNNKAILDYYVDNSIDATNSKLNKYIYSGIKQVNNNGVITYKVRITEFINKILKEKIDNGAVSKEHVRLGVVVTENINMVTSAYLKDDLILPSPTDANKIINRVPVVSVMNPLGTVLYGTGAVPVGKEVKFEIYYTKPN